MKFKNSEKGFSYVETIIAMIVLMIGVLGALSALSWGIFYTQESEKRTQAKEIAQSIVETIFAVRDMRTQNDITINSWDSIQIKTPSNNGLFIDGWYPVRATPGDDAIYGTADDSCAAISSCNSNTVNKDYERKIEIKDISEGSIVRKRRIDVSVRYFVGTIQRSEKVSTIISNLPFN